MNISTGECKKWGEDLSVSKQLIGEVWTIGELDFLNNWKAKRGMNQKRLIM